VTPSPGLYVGTIRHRRFSPQAHESQKPVVMAFLDVDRLSELMSVSPLTGYKRSHGAAFSRCDHLGDPARPLRERLRKSASAAGHILPNGPVYLLTQLRREGHVLDPISLFYCYSRAGHLRLVLADVNGANGGRESHWLRPIEDADGFRAVSAKPHDVSPDSDLDYDFTLSPPDGILVARMHVASRGWEPRRRDRLFEMTLTLQQRPWTARAVRTAVLGYPWMTARSRAAAQLETLKQRFNGLSVKGLPRRERDATTV